MDPGELGGFLQEENMRVHYMVGALLTAALITGCQTSTAADEEAIREMVEAWDASYNGHDADGMAAQFTEDAVRMNPNEAALQGREAIRADFVTEWESGGRGNQGELSAVLISGDLAAVRGTWTAMATDGSGPLKDRGYWMAVYQRQDDGSWECVWNMGTNALPRRER